jgi:hypothetical protein
MATPDLPERDMQAPVIALALLAALLCSQARASEAEFQITPRLGFGEITLDPGVTSITTEKHIDTADAGVSFGYVTPFGLVLEGGLQFQSNFSFFGTFDELAFLERYVAAGYQLEFGNGFRLTPKVGRTRWRLRNEEGRFLNPGPEAREEIKGYEDFWEVNFSKTISEYVALGVRYKSAEYDFGRVESFMFVTTFGFR